MARLSFYLDENIQQALAGALRERGVDILTTQEAGNVGLSDSEQLNFAAQKNRVLVSYNKRDFAKLHYEGLSGKRAHNGIVLSDQLPVGLVLRRIMKLYFALSSDTMKNRLEYLSSWK